MLNDELDRRPEADDATVLDDEDLAAVVGGNVLQTNASTDGTRNREGGGGGYGILLYDLGEPAGV